MSDNISMDLKKMINQTIKAFANLLKEFPKNAADVFVYDGSTLKKIINAANSLEKMRSLSNGRGNSQADPEIYTLKESVTILSQLLDELPKNPTDEFSYDPAIHRRIENARDTIKKLERLID